MPVLHARLVVAPAEEDHIAISLRREVEQPVVHVLDQDSVTLDSLDRLANLLEGRHDFGREFVVPVVDRLF